MKKKRFLVLAGVLLGLCTASVTAAEKMNYQNFELDLLLHNIEKPCAPIVTDDYIIFTADIHNRFVGIAFDFENYKVIHPFQIMNATDDEGKTSRKYMFYCYNRQHKISELRYRLVFDGLWAADPLNPNKEYDENVNLYFSKVEDPGSIRISTETTDDDSVHFIYRGKSGQKVRLSGTFTNWDPWIYTLNETSPGFYELKLPLTTGTYYYNYLIGMTAILDETNPNKAYTADGRSANVIKVN